MTTDPPEPKARRKWHFYKWLVLLIVATFAYAQWRAYTFRSALKQAEVLGWWVIYTEPFKEIRKDWKAAFKKETWLDGVTFALILPGQHFAQPIDIVQRLNPKQLEINSGEAFRDFSALKGLTRLKSLTIKSASNLTNLDGLQNLTALEEIDISGAAALTNVDGLKNLLALKTIVITDAKKLTNVDALQNLTALEVLGLYNSTALTNVNGLKNHNELQSVILAVCPVLTNVDGLKNLPALGMVRLEGCTGLTKESIDALNATLPNTAVFTGEAGPIPKPNELDTTTGARDTER